MRVLLKFEIDCDVDAAWRAIHSPQVLSELYGPLLKLDALSDLPTSWEHGGNAAVEMRAAGVPMGKQLISITNQERTVGSRRVRIMRDSGVPLTGPLATLRVWDHQMAMSEAPGQPDRTLWRDRLTVAGPTAPLLWPTLWAIWQWRELRIKQMASTWAFDPEADPALAPITLPGSAFEDEDEFFG